MIGSAKTFGRYDRARRSGRRKETKLPRHHQAVHLQVGSIQEGDTRRIEEQCRWIVRNGSERPAHSLSPRAEFIHCEGRPQRAGSRRQQQRQQPSTDG